MTLDRKIAFVPRPMRNANNGADFGSRRSVAATGCLPIKPEGPRGARRAFSAMAGKLAILGVLLGGAALSGCSGSASAAQETVPPVAVTVARPLVGTITDHAELTGQFSAVSQVVLLAQVNGYLSQIHFHDGQTVAKGDLLFVIDPRPYEIQLQQAQAQYQTAMAALSTTGKELTRSTELSRSGAESISVVDQATQAQRTAAASVMTAKAAIRAARLNLEFTRIRAPFAGRMSLRQVSIGSLVSGGATPTPLSSIVSLDPLHVDFDMSEADYAAYRQVAASLPKAGAAVVELKVGGDPGWSRVARLDFLDNQIDRSSGTLHARGTLTGGNGDIAPGQFAQVRVPTSSPRSALLIPDAAVGTDQSGKTLMIVGRDGIAVSRPVQTGALEANGMRVVLRGLRPDERVVINGLMQLRPGAKVAPRLVSLSDVKS